MTIEQLLEVAVSSIQLARRTAIDTDGNATAHISAYAAIAQAAAQTAQAMMAQEKRVAWIAAEGISGEVAEAAFYDANIATWRKEQEKQFEYDDRLWSEIAAQFDPCNDALDAVRKELADCKAERARYGDTVTSKLAAALSEIDRLLTEREQE